MDSIRPKQFCTNFPVAHLIGKTRNEEERFRKIEIELTKMGYICFAPVIYDYEVYKQYKDIIDKMCYDKLLNCDIVVIVTPEHIGTQTRERIIQAINLGIPVYTFNNKLIHFDETEIEHD